MTEKLPDFPPLPNPSVSRTALGKDNLPIILLVIAAIAGIIITSYLIKFWGRDVSLQSSDWGGLGSYVGGLTGPLFSLLGAVLIYKTFQAQKKNSDLQQFESTFFSLLTTQRDIAKNLYRVKRTIGMPKERITGSDYLRDAADRLRLEIERHPYEIKPEEVRLLTSGKSDAIRNDVWLKVRYAYQQMYEGRQGQLDHYFRHLYHIVKYTKQSYIEEASKREYIDIVQAQMSDDELYLAFYNGIAEYGYPNFYLFMEEYQFTENMRDRGKKQVIELHKKLFYPKSYPGLAPAES